MYWEYVRTWTVFKNKALRRIFERKREDETVGRTKLHNEKLHYCYCSRNKKAVCKVRGLTLLLRVGTLWRCGDGLFFEVPPLASVALLTTLHPILENVLQTVDYFEISCLGAPFSLLKKPRNRMGARSELYGGCSNGVPQIHFFQAEHRIQFRSRLMRFLGFSSHEKGAPKQEVSKLSTICSRFSRSGWSVARSASHAKGGTSKKRQSRHFHKVQTRSNKVSP
jgi:hypothetical protein